MRDFTVATRASALAVAQVRIVISALERIHPGVKVDIKKLATEGDRDKHTSLWKVEGTGFFTTAVEDALLAGEADFAVHSLKDLPCQMRQGLTIAAICDRRFPQDCLVAGDSITSVENLPQGARIGTSSLRRMALAKQLRDDVQALSMRGNVKTRIKAVDEKRFNAVILARAGLERLGLGGRISVSFDPRQFICAPAQGALAVQCRSDDNELVEIISAIDDEQSRVTSLAERQVLQAVGGGCHAPVGAFAELSEENITISAFISDPEGANFVRRQVSGQAKDAMVLAEKMGKDLLDSGGREILESIEN